MPAAAYSQPKLPPEKQRAFEQGEFDFLLPASQTFAPRQLAERSGWSINFVYAMAQEGKLEALEVQDRKYSRKRITRRSAIVLMAEMANYTPSDLVDRLAEVAATLTKEQYALFTQAVANKRSRTK